MPEVIKQIFCAGDQRETAHTVTLDKNREVLATCNECSRHVKFPMPVNPSDFEAMLAAHKASNHGQVTVEMAAEVQKVHDDNFLAAMGIEG